MSYRPLETGFIALHTLLSATDRVITITPAYIGDGLANEEKTPDDRKSPVPEHKEDLREQNDSQELQASSPVSPVFDGVETPASGTGSGVQCACGACECPLRWLHGEDLQ